MTSSIESAFRILIVFTLLFIVGCATEAVEPEPEPAPGSVEASELSSTELDEGYLEDYVVDEEFADEVLTEAVGRPSCGAGPACGRTQVCCNFRCVTRVSGGRCVERPGEGRTE